MYPVGTYSVAGMLRRRSTGSACSAKSAYASSNVTTQRSRSLLERPLNTERASPSRTKRYDRARMANCRSNVRVLVNSDGMTRSRMWSKSGTTRWKPTTSTRVPPAARRVALASLRRAPVRSRQLAATCLTLRRRASRVASILAARDMDYERPPSVGGLVASSARLSREGRAEVGVVDSRTSIILAAACPSHSGGVLVGRPSNAAMSSGT